MSQNTGKRAARSAVAAGEKRRQSKLGTRCRAKPRWADRRNGARGGCAHRTGQGRWATGLVGRVLGSGVRQLAKGAVVG